MSDIDVVRFHSLPVQKAKALVQKTADDLAREYGLSSEWHGNTLHFHRAGVDGQMQVTGSEVRLHAALGFLLTPLRASFVDHIERNFDKLFGKRGGKTAPAAG